MNLAPAFEVRRASKHYGGLQALRDVNLALNAGEVHGLIGANGAGKSTLCKIIAGAETPSSGALFVSGREVSFSSVRDAASVGVEMVHQELSLFPSMSVADNMFIGRELRDGLGLVNHQEQAKLADATLARLGHPMDPGTSVGSLPIGLQQIVEIARALAHSAKILLLDEPTSALSASETPRLFQIIRGLQAQGVAIVYISHRLDELLEICDCVTVLKDGEVVAAAQSAHDINAPWIVEKMMGEGRRAAPVRRSRSVAEPLLRVRGLTLPRRIGRVALDHIDLDVGSGEVVGVFGLLGAGRSELLETLAGLHADARGVQTLNERDLSRLGPSERIIAGLALTPEDRQRDGLFSNLPVLGNISLAALSQFSKWAGFDAKAERTLAQSQGESLRLKAPSLDAPVWTLSGGNQQKVVLARCLLARPKVLLLDEPTRGVDVAAKADIMATLHSLAADGMGVLFTSSEVSEVMASATRVIVLSRGRVALNARPEEVSEAILSEIAAIEVMREDAA